MQEALEDVGMRISGVLETSLYVEDLGAAERFYSSVLGLTLHSRQANRHVFFRCGGGMLLLFDAAVSSRAESPLPPHGAQGPGHVAFAISEEEFTEWAEHFSAQGVAVERIVAWPHGGHSLYARDPSGNSIELATARIWEGGGDAM